MVGESLPAVLDSDQLTTMFSAFCLGVTQAMAGCDEVVESQEIVVHPDGLETKTCKRVVTNKGPQKWACDLFAKMLKETSKKACEETKGPAVEFWEIVDGELGSKKKRGKK